MNGQPAQNELDKFLREAASRNAVETVESLIAAGADPYAADEKGFTAFNHAASNGLRALAWLVEQAFDDAQKPEKQRRWKNHDLNTPSGYYGSTLITYAAKACPSDLVKRMVAAGADISVVNGSGWTLLHCATVMPGRAEVLAELMRAFRKTGRRDLIESLSTQAYETEYKGHKVVYGKGLTATGLCRARIEQDPECPAELSGYPGILGK